MTSKIPGTTGLAVGSHLLKLWSLEPTLVLTKLVVDVGGLKTREFGPPECFMLRL